MLFNFDDMEETILHNFNGGKNDTRVPKCLLMKT